MNLKARPCALLGLALLTAGCAISPNHKSIELLENRMSPMIAEGLDGVVEIVTEQLGFRFLSKWAGMNPTPETVGKKTPRQASFSTTEATEIFREKGFYDVMIYTRSVDEGRVCYYDVDSERHVADADMFQGWHNQNQRYRTYVFARLVFKDKRLHAYKFIRTDIAY